MDNEAYITAGGAFLPGDPVPNEDMSKYLGVVTERSEKLGKLVLRQNRIKTRHYALSPEGTPTYANADMAARAAMDAVAKSEISLDDIDFLATSTTQGDLLVPGHASAVHAALNTPPIEIASFQSVCASSMMATKMAYLQIKSGEKRAAAVTGSEFSSRWFRPGFYTEVPDFMNGAENALDAEFLRWTLSDGAGAIILEPKPNERQLSFKVEWIDLVSQASRYDVCMYAGVNRDNRYSLDRVWSQYESPLAAIQDGAVMLLQDFDLLKRIIRGWVARYLELVDQGRVVPDDVDWLLCHYSAHSLREEIISILETTGGMIPEERWYTNLPSKGNTGAASLFVMLDEFIADKKPKSGDTILCVVPESGRSVVSFMKLTTV